MGAYLPDRIVTNAELAASLGVTESWILERCGIEERRFAADGEGTAAMGAEALRRAISDAGWALSDVEFVIFATLSPDHMFPGSGCYAHALLGLPNHVGVLDVRNQCSGFLYGLVVAHALIASALYSRIALVGADIHSHCLDVPETNREVAILFGDGAAAVALEASEEPGLMSSTLHVDGTGADHLKLELFDTRRRPWITQQDLESRRQIPVMDGSRVFLRAVCELGKTAYAVVHAAHKTLDDVDLVIPHQANLRINETVRKRLGLPPQKMFHNIQKRGNTTAASIPLAMVEAREAGILKRGQLVLLLAFGSGFTWGGALLRY